jgi:hypothetical protein
VKKKPKLTCIKKPLVVNGSSCKGMEEEPTRTSEQVQVLQEKANLSEINESSTIAVLSTKNADISDKMSQMTPSDAVISALGSRHSSSQKRSWCHICRVPNPAELVCCRLHGSYFKCHEVPRDASSPSGMRTVTAGSSCESTQEEPD